MSKENIDKPQRTQEELRSALVINGKRLHELKQARKALLKHYRDDIHDVDVEIASILQQLN